MAPELHCVVERTVTGSGSVLKLRGVIDQTFDSMNFRHQSEGTTVIDLDGVTRITSFGVREWNKAIQLINAGYLGFINVRSAMVTQFNVVAGVAGNGQIVTMYAPFICSDCETAFETLFDLRTEFAQLSSLEHDSPPCPKCTGPSELDELPSVYLSFVKRQGAATPPPDFDLVVAGKTPDKNAAPPSIRERVQQEIEGTDTYLWLNGPLDAGLGLRRLVDSLEGTLVVIMQGVTDVGPGAGSYLAKLVHYDGGPCYFTRVPIAVRELLRAGDAKVQIASWFVSQACASCYAMNECEVDGGPAPTCSKCKSTIPIGPSVAALVSELVPLPSSIAASLAGRTGPRKAIGRGAFLSRFEVLRKIGSGGMGEVYLARMQGVGGFEKHVALKRILAGMSQAPSAIDMFLSEARLAARLSHRNIVQIFDVGHERGEFYIALEYVDGVDLRTLYDLCKRTDQLIPPAIAMQLIADVAGGLSAAHTHVEPDGTPHCIVHRDVSPHNILISTSGEAKITDFGIAKMESDPDETPESVTKGKLSYLAPEQVRHEGVRIEPRSDVFSLGVVLFQTLTMNHPFAGNNPFETLKAVLEKGIPSVSKFRERLPLVDAIIARATAKDLESRYPSAEAMRADLLAAIGSPSPDIAAWLKPLLKLRGTVAESSTSWSQETIGPPDEVTKVKPL